MKIEHIPRWVAASISKHFDANRGNVLLYIEGQDRSKIKDAQDYFELAFNGPHVVQFTKSEFEFYVEISLLISSHKDQKDLYKMHRLLGTALNAMATCIKVYRYGDGSDDDGELLGQLIRRESPNDPVDVANFGRIEPTQELEQGTVIGNYYMCLQE